MYDIIIIGIPSKSCFNSPWYIRSTANSGSYIRSKDLQSPHINNEIPKKVLFLPCLKTFLSSIIIMLQVGVKSSVGVDS